MADAEDIWDAFLDCQSPQDDESNIGEDLYTDLFTSEAQRSLPYEELQKKYETVLQHNQELQKDCRLLQQQHSTCQSQLLALKKNISALFTTARNELQRKDKEIATLRESLYKKQTRRKTNVQTKVKTSGIEEVKTTEVKETIKADFNHTETQNNLSDGEIAPEPTDITNKEKTKHKLHSHRKSKNAEEKAKIKSKIKSALKNRRKRVLHEAKIQPSNSHSRFRKNFHCISDSNSRISSSVNNSFTNSGQYEQNGTQETSKLSDNLNSKILTRTSFSKQNSPSRKSRSVCKTPNTSQTYNHHSPTRTRSPSRSQSVSVRSSKSPSRSLSVSLRNSKSPSRSRSISVRNSKSPSRNVSLSVRNSKSPNRSHHHHRSRSPHRTNSQHSHSPHRDTYQSSTFLNSHQNANSHEKARSPQRHSRSTKRSPYRNVKNPGRSPHRHQKSPTRSLSRHAKSPARSPSRYTKSSARSPPRYTKSSSRNSSISRRNSGKNNQSPNRRLHNSQSPERKGRSIQRSLSSSHKSFRSLERNSERFSVTREVHRQSRSPSSNRRTFPRNDSPKTSAKSYEETPLKSSRLTSKIVHAPANPIEVLTKSLRSSEKHSKFLDISKNEIKDSFSDHFKASNGATFTINKNLTVIEILDSHPGVSEHPNNIVVCDPQLIEKRETDAINLSSHNKTSNSNQIYTEFESDMLKTTLNKSHSVSGRISKFDNLFEENNAKDYSLDLELKTNLEPKNKPLNETSSNNNQKEKSLCEKWELKKIENLPNFESIFKNKDSKIIKSDNACLDNLEKNKNATEILSIKDSPLSEEININIENQSLPLIPVEVIQTTNEVVTESHFSEIPSLITGEEKCVKKQSQNRYKYQTNNRRKSGRKRNKRQKSVETIADSNLIEIKLSKDIEAPVDELNVANPKMTMSSIESQSSISVITNENFLNITHFDHSPDTLLQNVNNNSLHVKSSENWNVKNETDLNESKCAISIDNPVCESKFSYVNKAEFSPEKITESNVNIKSISKEVKPPERNLASVIVKLSKDWEAKSESNIQKSVLKESAMEIKCLQNKALSEEKVQEVNVNEISMISLGSTAVLPYSCSTNVLDVILPSKDMDSHISKNNTTNLQKDSTSGNQFLNSNALSTQNVIVSQGGNILKLDATKIKESNEKFQRRYSPKRGGKITKDCEKVNNPKIDTAKIPGVIDNKLVEPKSYYRIPKLSKSWDIKTKFKNDNENITVQQSHLDDKNRLSFEQHPLGLHIDSKTNQEINPFENHSTFSQQFEHESKQNEKVDLVDEKRASHKEVATKIVQQTEKENNSQDHEKRKKETFLNINLLDDGLRRTDIFQKDQLLENRTLYDSSKHSDCKAVPVKVRLSKDWEMQNKINASATDMKIVSDEICDKPPVLSKEWGEPKTNQKEMSIPNITELLQSSYLPKKKSILAQDWKMEEKLKIDEVSVDVKPKENKLSQRKKSPRKPRQYKSRKGEKKLETEEIAKDDSSTVVVQPNPLPNKRGSNRNTKKDSEINFYERETKPVLKPDVLSKSQSPEIVQEIFFTSEESKTKIKTKGKPPATKSPNKSNKSFKKQEIEKSLELSQKVDVSVLKSNSVENKIFSTKKDKFYKDWKVENEFKTNKPETAIDNSKKEDQKLVNDLNSSESGPSFLKLPESGELESETKIGNKASTPKTPSSENTQHLELSSISKDITADSKVNSKNVVSNVMKLSEIKSSIKKARLFKNWEIENEAKLEENKLKLSESIKEANNEESLKKDRKTDEQKEKIESKPSEKAVASKASLLKESDWRFDNDSKFEETKLDKSKSFFNIIQPEAETQLKIDDLENTNVKMGKEQKPVLVIEKKETEIKSPMKKTKFFRTWEKDTDTSAKESKLVISHEMPVLENNAFTDNPANYSLNWGIENGIVNFATSQNKIPLKIISPEFLAMPEEWKTNDFKLEETKSSLTNIKPFESIKVTVANDWKIKSEIKQDETIGKTLSGEKQFISKTTSKKVKYLKSWSVESEGNSSKIKTTDNINKLIDEPSLIRDKSFKENDQKNESDNRKNEITSNEVKVIDHKVPVKVRLSKEWEIENEQKLNEIKPVTECKPKSSLGKKAKLLKEWEIENAKLDEAKIKTETIDKLLDHKFIPKQVFLAKEPVIDSTLQVSEKIAAIRPVPDHKIIQEKPVRKSKLLKNWEIETESKAAEINSTILPPMDKLVEIKSVLPTKAFNWEVENKSKSVENKVPAVSFDKKMPQSKSPRQKKSRLKLPSFDFSFLDSEKSPMSNTSLQEVNLSSIPLAKETSIGSKKRKTSTNKSLTTNKTSQKHTDRNVEEPCSFSPLKMHDFSKSFSEMVDNLTKGETNPIKTKIKLTPDHKNDLSPPSSSISKSIKYEEIKSTPKKKACDSLKASGDSHKSHRVKESHKANPSTSLSVSKRDSEPTKIKLSRDHTTSPKSADDNKKKSSMESNVMKSFPAGGLTLIIKKDGKSMKVFSKSQSSESEYSDRHKKEETVKPLASDKYNSGKDSESGKIKKSSNSPKNKEHSYSDLIDKTDSSHKNKKASKKHEWKQSSPKLDFSPKDFLYKDSAEDISSTSICKKKTSKESSLSCLLNKELSVRVELSKMNLEELQKYPIKEESYKKSKKGSPRGSFSDNETVKEKSSDEFHSKQLLKDISKHDLSNSRRRSHDFVEFSKEDLINSPIKKKMKKMSTTEIKS